jgi:hypothetical protein
MTGLDAVAPEDPGAALYVLRSTFRHQRGASIGLGVVYLLLLPVLGSDKFQEITRPCLCVVYLGKS